MRQRPVGEGIVLSKIGIGCSRVGSLTNPVPMREIEATLEAAVAAGITLFDTADIYGQGDSERTLSRLRNRHPDRIFVTTKVGGQPGRLSDIVRLAKPFLRPVLRSQGKLNAIALQTREGAVKHRFPLERLRPAVDRSRRRLGVDQLDGLLLHSPSAETLRTPEINDFLQEMLDRKVAANVGAAIESMEEVSAALTIPRLGILQIPLAISGLLVGTPTLEEIQQRKISIIVREIFRRPADVSGKPFNRREALANAIAPDFVTSAIVGVSTRDHLRDLLPVS